MKVETHIVNEIKIAEIISDEVILTNTEDGLDLLGNLHYQGFDKIILHEKNIIPDFFNLKTLLSGKNISDSLKLLICFIGVTFHSTNIQSLQDCPVRPARLNLIS